MQVVSQCFFCKHFSGGRALGCAAFPDEVPSAIFLNERDHRKPFHGDHGIRWEPKDSDSERELMELVWAGGEDAE